MESASKKKWKLKESDGDLDGTLIKEKALTYAKELGYGVLQASDGRLNRLKRW